MSLALLRVCRQTYEEVCPPVNMTNLLTDSRSSGNTHTFDNQYLLLQPPQQIQRVYGKSQLRSEALSKASPP